MRDAMRFECDSDMRFADATDGRTDERRIASPLDVSLKAVDAGAHIEGFTSPAEVIGMEQLWPSGDRHPVLRTGDRDPIPSHVRAAVFYRDRGQCAMCLPDWPQSEIMHLDHITPWSAGGADTTANLRLLCERHNLERSNYVDYARTLLPATWWCLRCYDRDGFDWEYHNGLPDCPRHRRSPQYCRVVKRYMQVLAETGALPTWHQREPITDATGIAYCAHCGTPGLTDRPL